MINIIAAIIDRHQLDMARHFDLLTLYSALTLSCSLLVLAADPNPLQDFCIAVDEPTNGVYVNGKFCKIPSLATPDDFHFDGVLTPGDTSNPLRSRVTHFFVNEVPGINTLGVGLARIDYEVGGLNPPHIHPRATEMLTCLEGTLYVGFVATNTENKNRLFSKTLNPGEGFIFPMGMIHFQLNVGKTRALALASFGGQNPAVITVANAIFNSEPNIKVEVLEKAFQLDLNQVEDLLGKKWIYN